MRFKGTILPYLLSAILATAIVYVARRFYICDKSEYEADCFYNVAIAKAGPKVFCKKTFPHTDQSIWRDNFSDKELGYHFMLWGLMGVGHILGWDGNFPFHYQCLFFVFLYALAYCAILRKLRLRHSWAWAILLVGACTIMTYRLLSIRAYMLSMTLSLGLLLAFLDERFRAWRFRWAFLFIYGAVEAWCYSSPHLLLTTLVPCAFTEFLIDHNWRRLLISPLVFIAGILSALVFHPQFPNTFLVFKIQCINVVNAYILHRDVIPIPGGTEFYMTTFKALRTSSYNYALFLVVMVAAIAFNFRRIFRNENWKKNYQFNAIAFTAALNFLLSLLIFRFNEYTLAPICLLFAYIVESTDGNWQKRTAITVAFVCLFLQFHRFDTQKIDPTHNMECKGVAQWARENLPEETIIGNITWDTFPYLYYVLPEYRFSWGLDPAFTWAVNKEIPQITHDLCEGNVPTHEQFMHAFNTRFLYLHSQNDRVAYLMKKSGIQIVYAGRDGWIFDLAIQLEEKNLTDTQ